MKNKSEDQCSNKISRRKFLGRIGAGAVTIGAASTFGSGATPIIGPAAAHAGQHIAPNRFGRLFHLPRFASQSPKIEAALLELGKPGGLLDANDPLHEGPMALIVNPALSANNPNNTSHTAGITFMGQFLDHDMTFDVGSRLGKPTEPASARNARTPVLDLDSVYGAGPIADTRLYDPNDEIKFKVESGGLFEDLPRNPDHTAIIGDPRNDENLIIAGLHAAFLLFHNNAVELVRAEKPSLSSEDVFDEARRLTTWHYHWITLHEVLPLFIGQAMVDDIFAQGRRFYRPSDNRVFIPVEFQGAAYRFGHSMVRPSYRANLAGDGGQPFFAMAFDPSQEGKSDPDDLRGRCRAPRRFVGWQTFFDFGDGEVKPNKSIDTKISTPLFNLPRAAIPAPGGPTALAQRNLLRHLTWGLPSGQRIGRHMEEPILGEADLAELRDIHPNFVSATPLFYYILKEAEVMEGGLHLGPVGGRIVGEVIIGLLQTDPDSYLNVQTDWLPTLPTKTGNPEDFRMVDFLTFAGVDPASRGQ